MHIRCPRPYCASITSGSVPFRSVSFRSVPGFIASLVECSHLIGQINISHPPISFLTSHFGSYTFEKVFANLLWLEFYVYLYFLYWSPNWYATQLYSFWEVNNLPYLHLWTLWTSSIAWWVIMRIIQYFGIQSLRGKWWYYLAKTADDNEHFASGLVKAWYHWFVHLMCIQVRVSQLMTWCMAHEMISKTVLTSRPKAHKLTRSSKSVINSGENLCPLVLSVWVNIRSR